jgi:hypothetical protein
MNSLKSDISPDVAAAKRPDVVSEPGGTRQEVRCAVRFPLSLPVVVTTGTEEWAALTRNISASGVLFELNLKLPRGMVIDFSLRMPGVVLGTTNDVLVHCTGRVVRCSLSKDQFLAAATIDDYQFVEQ